MVVLSLFDGMSCGQQALHRQNIKVDKYYASEIDKHAITVTMANFPNTIQLGTVVNVDVNQLPKIDILLGGSPCQSFSFAGKRKGMTTADEVEILTLSHYLELKSEGYQFEGQSYLFWEYMRILTDLQKLNPNVFFLLENVIMSEKWERILTRAIGVNPIEINSALLSAQNRRRLYWTNIGMVPSGLFGDLESIIQQPKDKGVLLKDILQTEVDKKYYLSENMLQKMEMWEDNGNGIVGHSGSGGQKGSIFNTTNKVGSLCATDYKQPKQICVAMRGRNPPNSKSRKPGLEMEQTLEARVDGKTNCLTSVQKDNLVIQINPSKESNGKQPYQQNRIYDTDGIAPALCQNKADLLIKSGTYRTHKDGEGFREIKSVKGATIPARAREDGSGQNVVTIGSQIRRLTPIECERLQTVDDNYTAFVSDTQRYKMLGNGWTVDVIAHIFSYLPKEYFSA